MVDNKAHVKVGRKFWTRSGRQWLKDQPAGHDVQEFWILQEGKVLYGYVNKTTGKRIMTGLRKATKIDLLRENARKVAKAARKIIIPAG